ncbi:Replication factor C, subunit RFC4 [Teratosphaeriaceae sp. CCFEE 6253]|nr:Replication factor C, subunit RFC4 [Teratosphaeriaceae sp. CCFEE 6253]
MKILTPEEEREHYNATLIGGIGGGAAGVAAGALGVWAASQRYPAFRTLSLPFRAFLITSTGTFSAIVSADSYSRSFERARNPAKNYKDEDAKLAEAARAQKSTQERVAAWMAENRYSIVFGSWVASMATALGLVGRNPYLSTAQKLVQARVYAQGLTIAVVIISLAFETSDSSQGAGRWETVKIIDPEDPEHKHVIEKRIHHERYVGEDQWRDMIAAEEERMKERDEAVKEAGHGKGKGGGGKKKGHGDEAEAGQHTGKKAEEAKEKKLNAP